MHIDRTTARRLTMPAAWIAAGIVAFHIAVNALTPYGVHRDELLYLAMGDHLRLWRMDFPPFIALAANVGRAMAGSGLVAIRLLPALASGALVVIAALIAGALGGGRWSRTLAAVAMATSLLYLRAGGMLQPVVFDQLWWALAFYALVRIERARTEAESTGEGARWWIFFGWAAGLGLLTKFSALIFGFAVLLGIVATPMRRALRTPWPWVAGALAFAIGAPSISGQLALHFPVFGQMHDLGRSQLEHVTLGGFLGEQLLLWSPVAGALALVGAVSLVARRIAGGLTAGASALAAIVLLAILHGKAYYAGPAHPLLIAAGAVMVERWTAQLADRRRAIARVVVPALAVAYAVALLPVAAPILAPPRMARYDVALGLSKTTENNQGGQEPLPQDYADMLPWRAQAEAVAQAWRSLPPDERAQAITGAGNYGEAGAIDYYADELGIPHAISGAGSYWFFGPGSAPGNVAIVLGDDRESLSRLYASVEEFTRVRDRWAVGEEQDVPVWICRQPYATLQAVWPKLANN